MMGKTEITQGQWNKTMGGNPSNFKGCGNDCPVETVSWVDAIQFCNRLSDKSGLRRCYNGTSWSQNCTGYRLPTEAEWEYAARAGSTTRFAGGESDSALDSMGWYDENSGMKTHPVGRKRANTWGLYDMHGNVWEWVWDRYGYYPSGSVTDPVGPAGGSSRVFRGGNWSNDAGRCRSARRLYYAPSDRSSGVGFRLVRAAP